MSEETIDKKIKDRQMVRDWQKRNPEKTKHYLKTYRAKKKQELEEMKKKLEKMERILLT